MRTLATLLILGITCIFLPLKTCGSVTINPPLEGYTNHAQRVRFAGDLLRYFKAIDSSVPNLKPAELEWLKKEDARIAELKNHDSVKWSTEWSKLRFKTKDYLINQIKLALPGIEKSLTEIIEQKEVNASSPRREMENWVSFQSVLSLSDLDEYLLDLRDVQVDNNEETLNTNISIGLFGSRNESIAISGAINFYVMLPLLQAGPVSDLEEKPTQNK